MTAISQYHQNEKKKTILNMSWKNILKRNEKFKNV